MEKSLILTVLCTGITLLNTGHGFPIEISSVNSGESSTIWLTSYLLPGIGLTLILVGIIFGCVCCRNNKGFKPHEVTQEFSNSSGSLAVSHDGFVNPTLNSELTIFPPLGSSSNEICRFEPLPDIKPPTGNLRPAAFSYAEQEISSRDWFFEPYSNFPRSQLKYVQEYGRGWFGRVVEGEAQNIVPHERVTKTMVKILHEDATHTDQMYFLHEVKFYRDLKHPNVLRLLGRCLETEPFLIILECYPNGDLKTFLSQNLASARALVEQGVTLQMCSNIANGLQFMHQNKFIHTDLAARNCLVAPDLTVKIGDYGNSIEIFNSDYYCAGSVALPVRWCAPETLKCTDITIETREVTQPANIWSLGVVFWEICEFCKLPYAELNDDQVIVRVLGEKNYFLEKPKMMCLFKDEMYHLMKLCWNQPLQRPTASQILVILNNLISSNALSHKEVQTDSKRFSQNFEQRWQNLKPNSIPKKDNASESEYSANCGLITSKLKNAKVVDSSLVDSPLGIFMSSTNTGQEAHRVCLKSDGGATKKNKTEHEENIKKDGEENIDSEIEKSNCVTETDLPKDAVRKVDFHYTALEESHALKPGENFKGTQPDMDSWLKGVEINNEEDESFVRKISEAIRDLDAALALEKTSSSEENSGKSSNRNSPGKEVKEIKEPVIDFKLGSDTSSFLNFTQKSFEISSLQNTEQPQSLNFTDSFIDEKKNDGYEPSSLILPSLDTKNKFKNYSFYESLKENDSLTCGQSRNSSDTDDETWRKRIEKGEISEKVKEKSKSIANLMVLTHIDSDDSDADLDKPLDKSLNRSSFSRRSGSFAKSSPSNNFGSENDLAYAVLEEDFKESLKRLNNDHKEHGHFDSLGVILSSSANRVNIWENFFKPTETLERTENISPEVASVTLDLNLEPEIEKNTKSQSTSNFLGDIASEKVNEQLVNFMIEKNQSVEKFNEKENDLEKDVSVKTNPNCDNVSSFKNCSVSVNKSSSQLEERFVEDSDMVSQWNDTKYSREQEDESYVPLVNNQIRKGSVEGTESLLPPRFDQNADEEAESSEIKLEAFLRNKNPIIPEIKLTEAEEDGIDTVEEVFIPCENKCKPFKFVVKDDICISKLEETPACDFESLNQSSNPLNEDRAFILDKRVSEKLEESCFSPADCEFVNKLDKIGSGSNLPEDNATVIIGACEDFMLDFYRGLKTASEGVSVAGIGEEANIASIMEDMRNKEANLERWDQHLEKTFTQQLSDANFDYISFRSSGLDSYEDETKSVGLNEKRSEFPLSIIVDFIEAEKIHTEKMEESIHLNRLTGLTVMPNEEEYENFKLRTPDDERSSDSGFRDKGSLSESVEDACEGKYNLEDIEAELEEAYVKGVFGNCEMEKEKENSKNFSNFEFEEAKFYEDENKNEEDYSDIDGEIDFWQNKDDSDYYPEISEFSATCSQGWYLHPPEENIPNHHRNVNEDLVNALRNELRESLPIQIRSFDQFNDFYETEIKEAKRDLNIHYASDFGLPLSPITEEQNTSEVLEKNNRNSFFDGYVSNKCRRNMTSLMESAKAIDTNTFMQYLDYMIENEGRDLDDLEPTEDEADEVEKKKKELNYPEQNFEEEMKKTFGVDGENPESLLSDTDENSGVLFLEDLELDSPVKKTQKMEPKEDLLIVNTDTDEATLLEGGRPKDYLGSAEDQGVISDCSENDGLIFTPEMLSPEKERSLSEISKSSNGTRTGDALSDITMSSPDLIPDCFTSGQDILTNNEASEITDELRESGVSDELRVVDSSGPAGSGPAKDKDLVLANNQELDSSGPEGMQKVTSLGNQTETNDIFEMSTSFMWSDEEDEKIDGNDFSNLNHEEQRQISLKGRSHVSGWESDTSENEDLSSSSGEFIWKDGEKESKLKVVQASGYDVENSVNETSQSDSAAEITPNEISSVKCDTTAEQTCDAEDDDYDNESSTESSASITDFVPSAWNSQATPSRPALRSPDKKQDQRKKSVWFKKQKYHCVYEYPQEPSDDEEGENSTFKIFSCDKSPSDSQNFLNYDVTSFESPNFSFSASKVSDYLNYSDWDLLEEDKGVIAVDPKNGFGNCDLNFSNEADASFFDRDPFDCDFNSSGLPENENEFLVSSSSRPFHGSSSSKLYPGNDSIFVHAVSGNEKAIEADVRNSSDFATPDSGLEDSTHTDLGNEESFPDLDNSSDSKADLLYILDNFKLNFPPKLKEIEKIGFDSSGNRLSSSNGLSNDNSPLVLGELRYARDKLKLDLPHNHNADLGAVVNTDNEQ